MKVLIVVDVQNDFCPGGSLPVNDGDKVVDVINRLAQSGEYDLIVASKDWHPANHLSFAENHAGTNVFDEVYVDGLAQTLWPTHCVQGTPGAEFHPGLDTSAFNGVIEKGLNPRVDSYSAFCDNGGQNETRLRSIIEQAAAKKGLSPSEVQVDVTGLALDVCVAATARDAVERGFNTSIILDASRAVVQGVEAEKELYQNLMDKGIELVTSGQRLPERSIERELPRERDRGMQR